MTSVSKPPIAPTKQAVTLKNLTALQAYGAQLSQQLPFPYVCYLEGDLGAGKTSLVQGIMQGFGYTGAVTSPTYNLIHEYPIIRNNQTFTVMHIDLYRLDDPSDVYELGLLDLLDTHSMLLIEWSEKGRGYIPPADQTIILRQHSAAQPEWRLMEFI